MLTPEIKTIQSPTPSFILFLVMADDISAFPVPLITFFDFKRTKFLNLYLFVLFYIYMSFILESKAFKCLFNRNIPSLCKFYLLKINQFLLWILALLFLCIIIDLLQMTLRHQFNHKIRELHFIMRKSKIKMNATMFSLFHSIKFSQFCALFDGGHSDTKGDLRDYLYMH